MYLFKNIKLDSFIINLWLDVSNTVYILYTSIQSNVKFEQFIISVPVMKLAGCTVQIILASKS